MCKRVVLSDSTMWIWCLLCFSRADILLWNVPCWIYTHTPFGLFERLIGFLDEHTCWCYVLDILKVLYPYCRLLCSTERQSFYSNRVPVLGALEFYCSSFSIPLNPFRCPWWWIDIRADQLSSPTWRVHFFSRPLFCSSDPHTKYVRFSPFILKLIDAI